MMTRKHFQGIADVLNLHRPEPEPAREQWATMRDAFAAFLATQNPAFDRIRFISATEKKTQ
jgi:hypothetical protein